MNRYAAMFASYLKEGGLSFQMEKTNNCERIVINEDDIEIDDSSCRFTRVLSVVPPNKMDDMLQVANQLNKEYNYVGFYILPSNPSVLCASYYFYLYGSEKEVADQVLKKYYIFRKSLTDAFGK